MSLGNLLWEGQALRKAEIGLVCGLLFKVYVNQYLTLTLLFSSVKIGVAKTNLKM